MRSLVCSSGRDHSRQACLADFDFRPNTFRVAKCTRWCEHSRLSFSHVSSSQQGLQLSMQFNLTNNPLESKFPSLDSLAVGKWWTKKAKGQNPPPTLDVPRNEVIAFAVYTQDRGILKMTAQLFPLKPEESRVVRLEIFTTANRSGSKQRKQKYFIPVGVLTFESPRGMEHRANAIECSMVIRPRLKESSARILSIKRRLS